MLEYFTASAKPSFSFSHENRDMGGTKYPTKVVLRAHHPNTGEIQGELNYYPPKRKGGITTVSDFGFLQDGPARGAHSALMNEMEDRHPGSRVVFLDDINEKNKPKPGDPNFNANREYGLPTDWDHHYPRLPGDIHRGMGVRLESWQANKIHSTDHSAAEQGKLLRDAVRDGGPGGMHWSADPKKPVNFANRNVRDPRTDVPVILHAETPPRKDIEVRPNVLRQKGVWPHDHYAGDAEVPIAKGKPVKITGVSWLPEVEHPEADEHGWVHHTFDEPLHRTAVDYFRRTNDDSGPGPVHRLAGRGKPRRDGNAGGPAPQGAGGDPEAASDGGEANPGASGVGQARTVEFHPRAVKDLQKLDGPMRNRAKKVIDGLANNAPGLQTHALYTNLAGYSSTKINHDHRIVHRPTPKGGLHIIYVGLHGYDEAARRTGTLRYFADREIKPLPKNLYHVTTARDDVLTHGLKTRNELGQQYGHGFGSGTDDTISLTEHEPTAHALLHSMHEYHDVLNGKIPLTELKEKARNGVGAQKPYDFMLEDHSDDYLADVDKGHLKTPGFHVLGQQPKGWTPLDEGMTGPDGTKAHTLWSQPLSEDEKINHRSKVYKDFSWGRQASKGHMDPLFMGNDPRAFAKKDPSQFALLHVRSKDGAHGIQMNDRTYGTDAGEWRAHSGDDLDVVANEGVEDIPPRTAALSCSCCGGVGDHGGIECNACDSSGQDEGSPNCHRSCPCGLTAVHDWADGWQHEDGSVSHGGAHQGWSVSDLIKTAGHPAPTSRVFGPTFGLDHRLFEGEHLKPEVRTAVLARLGPVIEPVLGPDWQTFTRVYLAGSEASEWTSATLEGNGDFDTLLGVDYYHARKMHQPLVDLNNSDITDLINSALRDSYNASPWKAPFGGDWDLTGYTNGNSWDITKIKPYAAYNISDDTWAVRPPHLPNNSIDKLPEGGANLLAEAEGYASVIEAIEHMPEPYRTQQGKALWHHLHSDRARAFSDDGEGWYDPGNLIEKALVEWGLWDRLVEWQYGTQKTAGQLPDGVTFEHRPSRRGDEHTIIAHHPDAADGAFDNYAGHLTWFADDGQVAGAWVHKDWQRKGIGTEMLRRAREIQPEVHHAPEAERSPEGAAWIKAVGTAKTAGIRGDLPQDLTFVHHLPEKNPHYPGDHTLTAHVPNGAEVGALTWFADDGMIRDVNVHAEHQRRGLATELLHRARGIQPEVHHSESLTPDGKAWAQRSAIKVIAEYTPVEHVRVDKLWPHREWNHAPVYSTDHEGNLYAGRHDQESWDRNRASVDTEGIREPITLQYNHKTHSAYIGEGNHRLHWAKELGHETVPVRIWRSGTTQDDRYKLPGEAKVKPNEHGYFPQSPKPSDVLPADWFQAQSKTAVSKGAEEYGKRHVDRQLTRETDPTSGDDDYMEDHDDAPHWLHAGIREQHEETHAEWDKMNQGEADRLHRSASKLAKRPMFIGVKSPHSIFNDGRMKSLAELEEEGEATHTDEYIKDRHDYEHHVMGVDHQVDPQLRPIYGSLHDHPADNTYGKYHLELKDHVRPRTTVTLGDSLNYSLRPYGIDHVDKLTPAHLKSMSSPHEVNSLSKRGRMSEYMEFQVHGGLGVDDVKRIHMYGQPTPSDHALVKKAQAHGIEVVHYPSKSRFETGTPMTKQARKAHIILDLGHGSVAHYRPGMGEREKIDIDHADGHSEQRSWGSLIALSNGEVLSQVRQSGTPKTASVDEDDHHRSYTDWDRMYPKLPEDIHRGIAVQLPPEEHQILHDKSRSEAERAATALQAATQRPSMHWSAAGHEMAAQIAEDEAEGLTGRERSRTSHILLHADRPEREHIETDMDRLVHNSVISHGSNPEREVPLKAGAPVHVWGVSWRHHTEPDWHFHAFDQPVTKTAVQSGALDLPQEQHDAFETDDRDAEKRKLLDLAKNPVPGTHIWRGEVRGGNPLEDVHTNGVGIHWSVHPDDVLHQPVTQEGHQNVLWHGVVDRPGEQNYGRDHAMWRDHHMSWDREAEVRLKHGGDVRMLGAWIKDPHHPSPGGTPVPRFPEYTGPGWKYHEINKDVPVAHKPMHPGTIDYNDVGIQHEAVLAFFKVGMGAAGPLPEGLTFRHADNGYSHSLIVEHPDHGEIGYMQWSKDEQPAADQDDTCPTCQRYQWGPGHKHPAGEIEDIDVVPGWRRQGVGKAMLEHARSLPVHPKPVHSDVLTDDGRAWAEKNASLRLMSYFKDQM